MNAQLTENGALRCSLSSTDLKHVTHLIADTSDFPAYHDAIDAFIHVVRPEWVDMSIMKKKAMNPRQFRPDPCLFLSSLVIAIAEDIPQGDKDALVGGIIAMGGQYSSVLTKLVTHVIALSMENPQCRIIEDKRLRCKPVLPHWLDHCLLLGKHIQEDPYVLPDPAILDQDESGTLKYLKYPNRKNIGAENVQGASSFDAGTFDLPEPVSPSKNRRALRVFHNHCFLIDGALSISADLRGTLKDLIERGGGQVTERIREADAVIVGERKGMIFQEAVEQRKDIGSLSWLYNMINTNRWTDPLRKLLHYPPICKPGHGGGIRGFHKFKISVSNYTGEARIYLENLVKAAGGTFTKTLTQENTHLITAHKMSDKVEAAQGWGISVVNHLWLEESYAGWTIKPVTDKRYITFPEKTNLGEVVGQTPINREVIEKLIMPDHQSPTKTSKQEPLEPTSPNVQNPLETPNPSEKGRKDKKKKHSTVQTPNNDKENLTPGSRGAKDRALNKLHLMAPDIELFNKESKRKGGVVYGGRKVADAERISLQKPVQGRKRSSSGVADESATTQSESEGTEDAKRIAKRAKTSRKPFKCRFMVTGGDRFGFTWNQGKSERMRKLGAVEISDLTEKEKIDVLVATKISKTPKFLAGIAAGAQVVSPGWLRECLARKDLLDPTEWALKDQHSEKEHGARLHDILAKASTLSESGGMLHGLTIYCTEHISPDTATYQDLVMRNGGKCLLYKGRETKPPIVEKEEVNEASQGLAKELVLITAPQDRKLWSKFKAMAKENGYKPMLVSTDWCVRVCLVQDPSVWDDRWAVEG